MNNAPSSSSVIIYLQMAGVVIFLLILSYIAKRIEKTKKENQIKTLLLTSSGMPSIKNDLKKLLQKPFYDVTVGFITTAAKPQENIDYVQRDWDIMKEELRFEVEEIDIEGKTEDQVMRALEFKDIIFVEGGNTFYLLKAMRACNFERVIKKLLKQGKVYIGVSAGSMVAGKTIITSVWRGEARGVDRNVVGLKNFKGMNLVPFDIFVHYGPEYEAIIKQKMPNSRKRAKNLKIITDEQAILIQGKEINLIGEGEAVVI